jgi:phosphohistidine phosphatase
MRRLLLLRHAKSDWSKGIPDIDRPLAPRGREAAPRMGGYLKEQGLRPDLALVSPALRARQTFELVEPFLDGADMRAEPRLYDAPASRLLTVLREAGAETRTLMMIGHNPGLEELARLLVGAGDRDALSHLAHKYPTAGLAVIDFPGGSWADAAPRAGRLDRFVTPKGLGAGEDD